MDDQVQAKAVAAARQLLLRYKAEQPGWTDDRTPVDELASWLGLAVETFHPNDYPQGTYGFLEPDEDLIWLCRDLSEALRRFTLAHELGHVVLHRSGEAGERQSPGLAFSDVPALSREDPCLRPDVQEETMQSEQELWQEVLGPGQFYDPRSEREQAANIFAAELLMPIERVKNLYLSEHIPPYKLARIFDVSNAALLNRLAGLLEEPEVPERAQKLPSDGAKAIPKKQYDAFQQAAIEAPTPALIVAGPGSGKTSTLIGRTEYLIHTLKVQPEHLLALTFSRKAAQEMQERLEQVLDGGDRANEGMPTVSTFHAFCADLLRTHGALVGLRPSFALLDDTEGYVLLRQLTREMHLSHYRNLLTPAYYFPDFLKAISRAKDELITSEQYSQLAQHMLEQASDEEAELAAKKALEVASIYRLYEDGLQRRGDSDFGGLIMLAVQLLEQFPEVRAEQQQRFQHILVDEFQDINRASGVLLRLLAGDERRVWVVGDPDQAIYSFRGASPANIAHFQQDYPGAVVLPLRRNYRSRPEIVQLAGAFRRQHLEASVEREAGENQPVRLSSPETYVTLATAANIDSELAGLITDIRYKHGQGYAYQDMVVLCRRRAQARKITRALALAGLPILEPGGMLGQQHIKDLISLLLLLVDASGMGILRAARQNEHAFSQSDIEALLLAARAQQCSPGLLIVRDEAPPNMSREGRQSLTRLSKILQALWQYAPNVWSLLAQYLFIETSLLRDLLQNRAASRNSFLLADYTAFLQLARRYDWQQQVLRTQQEAEERGEKAAPPPTIQEQVRGFLDYLNVMLTLGQEGGSERQQSTAETDAENPGVIRVMTVHASKGLEFPIVYLPGLIQRNFPLQARANPVPAPAGMLPGESEGSTAHESGEACLFYVGVTRARDHLVLSYSERNGKQKARPSVYLEALAAGLPPERVTRLHWQEEVESSDVKGTADDTDPAISSQPSQSFIDAVKPTTLKVSDIETYTRCPRKYAYSTLYGFRGEEGSYQLFWQATQKTLEALQKNLAQGGEEGGKRAVQLLTQEMAQELYIQHWQELGGQALPFAAIYEQHGREVTELMRRKLLESENSNWELRPTFTVEVAGKTLHVAVDRVEKSPEGGKPDRFVRTRFARRKEKPAAGMRELLYARAYRQRHAGESMNLHFHNLSTGETFPITLTTKREQGLYDELEQSLLGLERNDFPAIPDAFLCPGCPYFLICPA